MATTYISLRISGSVRRQGGFVPIVIAGAVFPLSTQEENSLTDRPLPVNEKQAYAFRHRDKYILYQLIDTQVRSYDAATDGRLSIAVTIPSDKQLAGGRSPYTLLREVHELFRSKYMSAQPDGTHIFRNVDADSDIFRQMLDKYPTEQRASKSVTMSQQGLTAIMRVEPDKLEEFFSDTQYPEFKRFSEIVVATQPGTAVTPDLENLPIPRPSTVYSVWVNGRDTGKKLQDLDEQYTTGLQSNEDSKYNNVTFSLRQIIDAGENGITGENGTTIKIDAATNRIICTISPVTIFYNVNFTWDTPSPSHLEWLKQQIELGAVRINFVGKTIKPSDNPQVMPSLAHSRASISPSIVDNYKLSATTDIDYSDPDNKRVVIAVKMEEKKKNPLTYPPAYQSKDPREKDLTEKRDRERYEQKGRDRNEQKNKVRYEQKDQGHNSKKNKGHNEQRDKVVDTKPVPFYKKMPFIYGAIAMVCIAIAALVVFLSLRMCNSDKDQSNSSSHSDEPSISSNSSNSTSISDDNSEVIIGEDITEPLSDDKKDDDTNPYPGFSAEEMKDQERKELQQNRIQEQKRVQEQKKKEEDAKKKQEEERKKQRTNQLLKQGNLQQIIKEGLATPEQTEWINVIESVKNHPNPIVIKMRWSSYENWGQVKNQYEKILKYTQKK